MNLWGMRREFDLIMRTYGEGDFTSRRDVWLNMAWQNISEMFAIPSLNRTVAFDSVVDQQRYYFPYDYNGTEVKLYWDRRRLDPVSEHILALIHEKRSGNLGAVEFYDWSFNPTEVLASVTDCTLTNGSATVPCTDAAAAHVGEWIRFDPLAGGVADEATGEDYTDPGDYGYRIASIVAGVFFTLDCAYRGPSCITTGQVRPLETQSFIVYGIPSSVAEFELTYSAKPRRLYNMGDVPEWPNMGPAIVYMAVSIGLDFLFQHDASKVWWGRAMNRIKSLQVRREISKAELVSDMVIGSVSGRHTGARGVWLGVRRSYR